MKKISFIISLLIVSITYGQLGLSVGYGSAKAKVSGGGVSINTESMSAISLGLVYDSNISENIDLQPYFSFGIGEKIEGKIKSITDFGIFVGLEGEIDGLIHLSDISEDVESKEALNDYKKDQILECIVFAVDAERERISLKLSE